MSYTSIRYESNRNRAGDVSGPVDQVHRIRLKQRVNNMVADTKENVTQMFDNMTETFRVAMDAGRKTQENFVRSMNDMWKNPMGFENVMTRGERVAKEIMPFVGRNMELMVESFDTTFRTGLDVFRTATDATLKNEDTDMYRRSRQVFDAAFGAMRSNFETFGKTGARAMENWSSFCKSACCCEEPTMKTTAKPTK